MTENPTVFGKILAGELPAKIVHEDELCIVIEDIAPKAHTHLLIIPRQYMPTLMDAQDGDTQLLGHLLQTARRIADELGLTGYKLLMNVGKDGGQVVEHVHLHLLSGPSIDLAHA